jgi:predicted nuclease of predicted toxin-antitoxin system
MSRNFKIQISLTVAMATMLFVVVASTSGAEISRRDMQALAKTGLIYVATVRKDGNQSRSAPVWFTITADNNAILIQTKRDTWKAKRIRRGSPVLVWIGASDCMSSEQLGQRGLGNKREMSHRLRFKRPPADAAADVIRWSCV